MSVLDRVDLTLKLPGEEYDERLPELQARLHALQVACVKREVASVLVFEGWDAAGKGGAIRRLTPTLDPRAFEVVPIAAPTTEEAQHPYLWRFWRHLPIAGEMTIFDRSWYGRVLVERVEGYSTPVEWRRAYGEIVGFEEELAASGMVVMKFWLHISKEEQLRRFKERSGDRVKQYKIGPDDWRNRKKWNEYAKAVDEMVRRTSRPRARWTLVEAEDKRYARVKVLETVIESLERGLDGPSPAKRFRKIERKLKRLQPS
jgi:polyphosphate kinase 2 (PPK2 family)